MKKIGLLLLSMCFASLVMGACTIAATTTVDEKNKSTDTEEADKKNEEEEVMFNSIKNLYSTRCYNSIVLKWENPENAKLDKIRISYLGESFDYEAVSGEEMEVEIDNLENGKIIEFTVEAINSRDEVMDVQYISNYAGHCIEEVTHSSSLKAGDVVTTDLEYVCNASESGVYFGKYNIPEVVVIPDGKVITVEMDDDCSYNGFIDEEYVKNIDTDLRSCFEKSRSVVMSPYAMCVGEVNENQMNILDYKNWPFSVSNSSKTKTNITYLDAIKFCNLYTEATMSAADCVYYEDEECTLVYKDSSNPVFYINEYCKGYRLPTKAEWEFAARNGNPNSEFWKDSYAGASSSLKYNGDVVSLAEDKGLYNLLFSRDSYGKIIEKNNKLGLEDMTGSVWEFTLDFYYSYETDLDGFQVTKPYYIVRTCGGCNESLYNYEFFNSYSKNVSGKIYSDMAVEEQMAIAEKSANRMTGFRMVRNLD